ncbi:hypothetical protein VitviT2T_002556 [Vitis vinifera]|uniref:RRM domain-containing protein n=2 Tax=Vitis vinifera TaxID=29760 RepID=A0ABY9BJ69_VITVI|nr:hypothetical protein VitviT2T_002556 [Vitis vinifera]
MFILLQPRIVFLGILIKFGEVVKVIIVIDAATGQPKGSAYVEFMRKEAAEHAPSLDGTSFMSRILKVVKKLYPSRTHSWYDMAPHCPGFSLCCWMVFMATFGPCDILGFLLI